MMVSVKDLLLWRDIKKSGVVFGSGFVLLVSLALFSVLSVISYLSLTVLTITVSFRLYKSVLAAVQKTGDGHPFKYSVHSCFITNWDFFLTQLILDLSF